MPSPWLPVVILVIVGVAFAMLTRRVGRRIGRSPNRFATGDTAHDFVGRVYRISGAILFVVLIARGIAPEIDTAAGLIQVLAQPAITWFGLAIMAWGGVIILVAQVGMGASWRIGLDQEQTELVTTGLFAWSRNPTFLGMVVLVLGAFLVAPAAVTSIVLAVAWVAFSVQIRMEEEHLHRMHGRAYEAYRAAVPRWIGLPRSPARAPATQGHSVDRG
jgi:protein-S-isoprenylcysteine O-methyltransferase Ste14